MPISAKLILFAVLVIACAHDVRADKKTVCTITVNSSDEKDVLQRNLPPDDFQFVELVEPDRPDWFASACRTDVRCDVLVISGHFDAGTEFYSDRLDAKEYLPVEAMQRASCSDSCPGLFAQLREVYLFGCNTLNAEALRSASAEVGRSLLRSGYSQTDADRLARELNERYGESNRDRMRHVFKDVPVIYGFSSKAPLGRTAGPTLDRYFQTGSSGEIGSKMAERNGVAAQKITFRIGINVGDIIIDGDDIFGDGVNVAARIENVCEPGGVCLSGNAFEQVRGKTKFIFDDLGERQLKNIERLVRVYAVRAANGDAGAKPATVAAEPAKPALETGKPLALPNKPSIAVLPFQNMSGDPEQDHFADGIAEDIITALSRSQALFVIARNSSFTYKGRAVNLQQVGRELGVRYILEGSVRRVGNRVRITGQLIEAGTGGHLWGERYDGDLSDIFGLQDEITLRVAAAILPTMESIERERAARKPVETLGPWENYHRGLFHFYRLKRSDNEEARNLFQRAVSADDSFALAHAGLALTYFWEGWLFNVDARPTLVAIGVDHARKSVELEAREATGHLALAFGMIMLGGHDDALRSVENALSLNPNYAWAHGVKGGTSTFSGRWREALASIETAIRLSPFDPMLWTWLHWRSRSQYWSGDYASALATGRALCQLRPDIRFGYVDLICALGQLGRDDEAREVIADALARFGEPFRHSVRTKFPEQRAQDFQHLIEGYEKAGLFG